MITFDELQKDFQQNNINCFRVATVGNIYQTGLLIENITDFLDFIKFNNINQVFIYEHFENATDYYITEDLITEKIRNESEEFLNYILPQINKYNNDISTIDFCIPTLVSAICFYNNVSFFTNYYDYKTLNNNELLEPKDMLELIISSNKEQKRELLTISQNIIDSLREELKLQIQNDKEFLLCSNQQLRRDYARRLRPKLSSHFDPLIKVMYYDGFNILTLYGKDFIELIWRDVKDRNSKNNLN